MPELNKVLIAGRLTGDPTQKATPDGDYISSFTIAVDHYTKNKQEKSVSFFDIVASGNTAKFSVGYLKKGNHVLIDGRLRQVRYKVDIDGEEKMRSRVEIVTNSIFSLEPRTEKILEEDSSID